MRTIGQHRDAVAALLAPVLAALGSERRSTDDLAVAPDAGRGRRVLATAVSAPVPLPTFDNSQMDGFAVRAGDAGRTVRVVDPVPAGTVPAPLPPDSAAPIMTGARIPIGADAVVPVEAVRPGRFPEALALAELTVPTGTTAGTFVRTTGSDVARGAELAPAGAPVTPALLGTLASAGVGSVEVVRPVRVLVVSTGSELRGEEPVGADGADGADGRDGADGGADLGGLDGPGAAGALIGDANGVALRAALAEVGAVTRAVRLSDDPERFVEALDRAVGDWADLVLTTGGISAGAYEVVRQTLEPLGLAVTPVAMQPGGPQASGSVTLGGRTVPVVAFPGNPVSALVSFEVFLRPVLTAAVGAPDRPAEQLPAAESATSPVGKHQVRRGRVADGRVYFVGGPSSHLLAHLAAATHLVHVPVGTDTIEPGDPLIVWSLR
ncbi:molybdopterin molybdotransferase MoeA [Curtobacterium sp. MCBA15_012]|uniref:molybdopterin molybdotransferase MoeA n=1 Tax=Curtobacterium sp. MCBA15_012 TaxID=1898738 RepID=UPI0008DE4322|nr:molybdopterin molybdotransferase MoeA [Curtobacterium sp. MCBA15_012]WIB00830.1 molybdopterin molybdotransferase MoeA [Curtobacterium sp. MCBA15_012]